MSNRSYQISVPGKWILSGEHSVLRGFPAVALPHTEFHLTLRFEPGDSEKLTIFPLTASHVVEPLIAQLFEEFPSVESSKKACGSLYLESTIPVAAGFGSSAALCFAIASWFLDTHALEKKEVLEIASRLESQFHGKSSGLDITVVALGYPVFYRRGGAPEPLTLEKFPKFSFHDTGIRSSTRECIYKVEKFLSLHPEEAAALDKKMGSSSQRIAQALAQYGAAEPRDALEQLARAIDEAQSCFYAWNLVPEEVRSQERALRAQGARSVKLTGAGDGGFLVALWE